MLTSLPLTTPNSSSTATASEQDPRQTWQPHLAIATNKNCGDFLGIHYINIIKINPEISGLD